MRILGIETSCDETAAAVIQAKDNKIELKSNILATSLALHAKTGGIIPENAAREQMKAILPVITEALNTAFGENEFQENLQKIDAIAVTYGPGLIGSLLVGVETAKTLAYTLNKPLIPINHMLGHIYANWIENPEIAFPALALVVSGGHTDLLLLKEHGSYELLGGTRDDAAGEAFDKIGRLLGLAYPAGPVIEKLAKQGNPKRFRFPRPLIGSDDYEFSFSGLKTAVLREATKLRRPELGSGSQQLDTQTIADLCRGTQDAIIDVITRKALKAAEKHQVKSILLSGGVAANQTLRDHFSSLTSNLSLQFFAPAKNLCTDNAAMIASAAFYHNNPVSWEDVTADPELYFV